MEHFENTINEKLIYDGKVFKVKLRTATLENGKTATREIVCHNGGAAVLAIDENNDVYLITQYRAPFNTQILEIPAGKLEINEDPFDAVQRELAEEAGIKAKTYTNLGEFYPTVGFCDEIIYLYLAQNLTFTSQNLDEDEFVSVKKLPFNTAYNMCVNGDIKDGKTLVAILKAKEFLKL